MTRSSTPLAAGLAVAVALAACSVFHATLVGSGLRTSEVRPLPAFDRVSVEGAARVEVRQGSESSVRLEFDDNLLPHVIAEVENGRLRVRFERHLRYRSDERLFVEVVTPRLEAISAAGSVELSATALDTARLDLHLAGSGSLTIEGRAEDVEVDLAGSGDFDLSALTARRAAVSIAGSGDVVLQASEALDVSIAGSGDVRYVGQPAVTQSVAGSGSIVRLAR